jgi:hypothetical protein
MLPSLEGLTFSRILGDNSQHTLAPPCLELLCNAVELRHPVPPEFKLSIWSRFVFHFFCDDTFGQQLLALLTPFLHNIFINRKHFWVVRCSLVSLLLVLYNETLLRLPKLNSTLRLSTRHTSVLLFANQEDQME